jgi:hypothetical protein
LAEGDFQGLTTEDESWFQNGYDSDSMFAAPIAMITIFCTEIRWLLWNGRLSLRLSGYFPKKSSIHVRNFELPVTVRPLFHFFPVLPSVSCPNLSPPICAAGHRDGADSHVLIWQKREFL